MRKLVFLTLVLSLLLSAAAHAHVVVHKSGKSAKEVARYWTPKRMKEAIPVELASRPGALAGKPGGSAATSLEVPLPYPTAHGKVFFSDNSGLNYVCSGTAIASLNRSVVWTAGHCVNEGPGAFYKNFAFVPAYRDGNAPYGTFAAPTLLTTSGWQGSGQFGVDLGAGVVGRNGGNQTLNDAVGGRAITFNATRNQSYQLYGYPAAKRFNGARMRVCNTAWSLDDSSAQPPTMGVPCDMTGGSSGGGWVTSTGAVASVISYGYASLKNVLFGPHQESAAQQLFSTAERATP
jgi:V8-like Glu-specific endopeptidase